MAQTPSGECAYYVDENQFGQSQDTCGPEAVAQLWHSTAPTVANHYTAADIDNQADSLYIHFIGPDVSSDHNGTSNQTLYNMLDFVGFKDRHVILPLDANIISGWLHAGYAIIVGCAESSVYDVELGSSPYNWNTTGLYHIFNLTGVDSSGNWLARDTANIDHNGVVRPGPRHYHTSLELTSATLVAQSWMPVPTSTTPPGPPTPPPPAGPDTKMEQAKDYWNSTNTGAPYDSGIAQSWQSEYKAGSIWGPPLGKEFHTVDWQGNPIIAQMFAGGRCEWSEQNVAHWYPWE